MRRSSRCIAIWPVSTSKPLPSIIPLILQLAECAFTETAQNIVLVGGTGTGKAHLATALGVSGIAEHNKQVRFYSTVDLVNTLEQEKAAGKAGRLAYSPDACRSGNSRRTGLSAVQSIRWRFALPSALRSSMSGQAW